MRKIVQCSISVCGLVIVTACASQIALPGSVLPPQQEAQVAPNVGPPENWRAVDGQTGQISDPAELVALAGDFPESSSVRLRLLSARLRDDDLDGVLDQVEWLTARDYVFSPAGQEQLRSFYEGADLARLEAALAHGPLELATSTVTGEIPEDIGLPEAAFFDPQQERLIATSIVSCDLFVLENGTWRAMSIEGAGSLAGIALDAPRGLIWLGSGVVDPTPEPETAFRGIIAVDRITLEEVRRVAAPEGSTISDIAVGPDGTVYGSDPVGGGVYSAALGDREMQTFIAPGTLRSPQGIAVRPDNTALYISDYRYGLAQVVLRSRHVYRMRAAEPMLLDGVDGLWLHGTELIAVQNGVSPMRIAAFQLGQGIGVIAGHRVLERANPNWTEPLGGTITDGSLYYIGTGQWDIWGEGGVLNEGAETRASRVHRLQLVESPPEGQ